MQQLFLIITTVLLLSCASNQSESKTVNINNDSAFSACLNKIHIDSNSIETETFRKIWGKAEQSGYSFKDDTIVPFVKVIYELKSPKFYIDTLELSDCYLLDSLNIHSMGIISPNSYQKNLFPRIKIQEWKFKNKEACTEFAKCITKYYQKGYGLKNPSLIYKSEEAIYIFETAAYAFITELEKLSSTLKPSAKEITRNY